VLPHLIQKFPDPGPEFVSTVLDPIVSIADRNLRNASPFFDFSLESSARSRLSRGSLGSGVDAIPGFAARGAGFGEVPAARDDGSEAIVVVADSADEVTGRIS